jgi:hypothetical protein
MSQSRQLEHQESQTPMSCKYGLCQAKTVLHDFTIHSSLNGYRTVVHSSPQFHVEDRGEEVCKVIF